jgi:hypothetical protein
MQGELRLLPQALPDAAGRCALDRWQPELPLRRTRRGAGPRLDRQPGSQLDRIGYGRHEQHRRTCISFRTPTLRVEEEGEGVRRRIRGTNAFSPSLIRWEDKREQRFLSLPHTVWAERCAERCSRSGARSGARGAVRAERCGASGAVRARTVRRGAGNHPAHGIREAQDQERNGKLFDRN